MPSTDLILIRHGETDWNRQLRFQGHIDVPVNDMGHEQARRLGLRVADEPVAHLISSDLMRADEIQALHPRAWEDWLQFREEHAMPEGESARQFHTRIMDALGGIVAA